MKNSLRKFSYLSALLPLALLAQPANSYAQLPATPPDHIVVLILENYAYSDIIGSSYAPHINAFIGDTNAANFTACYALTHPSQPNYLYFFAGNDQGVTTDNLPSASFTTPNLASEVLAASKTFVTYSEDLPSVGYNGGTYTTGGTNYARKHNPVANWMGTGTNQVPTSTNQPMTAFPTAANYSSLPTISYVVPNQTNDMHDGTYPSNIGIGDTWLYNHLDSLKQWALLHNTLYIITYDEDDDLHSNLIPTIFYGPMVKGGNYSNHETLINILGTIESMYGLGHANATAGTDTPITYCWRQAPDTTHHTSGVKNISETYSFKVAPNPASNVITFLSSQPLNKEAVIDVIDVNGRITGKYTMNGTGISVNTSSYTPGVYYYKILRDNSVLDQGKFIITNH